MIARSACVPGSSCEVVCYADDTLILAVADDPHIAALRASSQVSVVLRRIRELGLSVATEKTEVVLFRGSRVRPPVDVVVGECSVSPSLAMKYLGVYLDSRLSFEEHFARTEAKLFRVTGALCRLMPNLRGPGERKRRLYANVISSVAMYGAPIWANALAASRRGQTRMRRAQKTIALRMICAYRTVSYDAACLLARFPPFLLGARMRGRIYNRICDLKSTDSWTSVREKEIRYQEALLLKRQWSLMLDSPDLPGARTRNAILPCFSTWLSRTWRCLGFHMVQILSGHGSFSKYLFWIGKAASEDCLACSAPLDISEHTIEECPAWETEREALRRFVGSTVSLPRIVRAITADRHAWSAFATFATKVMKSKEALERDHAKIDFPGCS